MGYNDIIGTLGVGLILIAYFLNMEKALPKDGKLFYALNIVGAALACYASLLINYWPFVILEGIWVIVSLVGFGKTFKS